MTALDIDNAVTLRLLHWDRAQRELDHKLLAYEVCKMAFGGGDQGSNEGTHPLIAADPFSDENTVIM